MRSSISVMLASATALVAAQRPSNMTICDYYTAALFTNETAANQYGLVAAVVNRAVIGNTTANPSLTGIVGAGMYNGVEVNLLPYFDGALNSSNRGGSMGVSVNFLDGGGAAPIEAGMPADNSSSNQYTLLTHLYEYFGGVLGCSTYGSDGYPAYSGHASMFGVHQYMGLDSNEVGYFIEQVGLSALSFGVTMDDVMAIGTELSSIFNVRCGPLTTVIAAQGPQYQSICINSTCALAVNSTCGSYPMEPAPTNVTMTNSTTTTSSPSSTSSGVVVQTTNAGASLTVGSVLMAVALAFAL